MPPHACDRRFAPRSATALRALLPCAVLLLAACTAETPAPGDFQSLAAASLPDLDAELQLPGLEGEVSVVRDQWGVPHIYAESREDLFFAQGLVQAQDRLWQMDMWRRVNEGRLAEILGPGAFAHDRLARLIMFRGPWEDEWTSYHPDGEMIFRRFAEGVNAWIDAAGDALPVEYRLTGLTPLRWTPEASTGRVATALPLGPARSELNLARQVARLGIDEVNRREAARISNWIELEVPEGIDVTLVTPEVVDALGHFRGGFPRPALLPEYAAWAEAEATENRGAQENAPGSNNWVAAPSRTRSGHVLLANDPHRGVTNPSLRYLVHLNAPGYNVIGSTEPAIPGVAIGHNGRVAWGLTIVGTDQADVFMERLNPENLEEVREGESWVPFRTLQDTIAVRGEADRVVTHRFTRNGPVFHVDSTNLVAWAVRSTANEPGTGGYLGALRLAETNDCHEFMEALAWYNAPSENMVCGDADGNISWLAAALTPSRVGGWHGRLPVPGWGGYAWDGFRPHMELPHEVNPERGWLGTANNDVQPEGYTPPVMFKAGPFPRWERLQELFEGATDLTAEDFEVMIQDAMHPDFRRDRPVFEGWRSEDPDVEWARAELEAWDGVFDRDAVAPALWSRWRSEAPDDLDGEGPVTAERQAEVEAALRAVLENLEGRLGDDRTTWRWGRIHRSEFPHWLVGAYDLPAVERSGGGGTMAATGATFREIIDFSDLDASRVTNTPGQSMQPGSPFYDNLLPLWAEGEFFPLLHSPEAVEAAARHRMTLRP
jgi:penicillin G amidase